MPTFHLVVDEVVPVALMQCRVRIWRQAGLPPLVLSSQLPGQPPPDCYSSLLANIVLRRFLGYSLPIPFFFELNTRSGKARAVRVRYDVLGAPLRPILRNPKWTPLVSAAFEQLFKLKLDTLT